MAARSAQKRTAVVTAFASTKPLAMVAATAVPERAPTRFQIDAQATARRGVSTFVDTTVAMAFAVSWKPLMYSNTAAAARTRTRSVMGAFRQECLSATWTTMLPAFRQRSTACSTISKSF